MPLVERGKLYGGRVFADIRYAEQRADYLHHVYEVFDHQPVCFDDAGFGDPTGSAGDENRMITAQGNYFEWHVIGTQSIFAPVFGANGLNVAFDQTNGDGVEITQGITARSRGAFVVGTAKAFAVRIQFEIDDVTGAAEAAVGFRKAEAYQAALDDYDELACLNMLAGDIKVETILNGGTTSTTDTTDNWADEATHSLTVKVDADGAVTFEIDDAAPTATATYSFDEDDVVLPFFYLKQSADLTEEVNFLKWECGYQVSVP